MKQVIKGRPNSQRPETEHEQRKKKSQQIKQHWTQHRITLIAYEAQYMHRKKPQSLVEEGEGQGEGGQGGKIDADGNHAGKNGGGSKCKEKKEKEKSCQKDKDNDGEDKSQNKKKNLRKKVNLQYQSGFLSICPQQSEQIKVTELIKPYQHLCNLFSLPTPTQTETQLQQFFTIMLQLKHSKIVPQFLQLYNIILYEISKLEFIEIYKEEQRFAVLEKIQNKLVLYVQANKQKFQYFHKFFVDDEKETKKLLLVEVYCFLAEKFCFNINQFYSQAFNVCYQGMPTKRVKKG